MRKKIVSIITVIALSMSILVSPVATQSVDAISVKSASVYRTTGYQSGYCVLSANIYMIRRAMIARGSTKWKKVNYKTAGRAICVRTPMMKWKYTFSKDGVKVKAKHIKLTGSASSKARKLRKLLDAHPEGVVVRGSRLSGYPHGALLTGYYGKKNYQFWVADSTHNASRFVKKPRGIEKWSRSTLNNVGNVQEVWYLTSITGIAKSAKSKFVTIKGKKYYINRKHKKVRGWYIMPSSKRKMYFSKKDGHQLFGWQKINGEKYYLNPKTGAAARNCVKTIKGVKYKFSKSGKLIHE